MLAHPEAVHVSWALDRHDSKTPSLGIARSAVNLVAALTSDYLDIIDKIAGDATIGAEQYVVAPQRLRVDGNRPLA